MNFKLWLESHEPKELVILRGPSSSGKSTLAKRYEGKGVIFSTDDFFMKDGKYQFDPSKLGVNHQLNRRKRTEEAMVQGISPIVIDNTNLELWEMKPYVDLADKYEYHVKILETDPISVEELLKRQEKRGDRNISKESLERMLNKFQRGATIENIRNSKSPHTGEK